MLQLRLAHLTALVQALRPRTTTTTFSLSFLPENLQTKTAFPTRLLVPISVHGNYDLSDDRFKTCSTIISHFPGLPILQYTIWGRHVNKVRCSQDPVRAA